MRGLKQLLYSGILTLLLGICLVVYAQWEWIVLNLDRLFTTIGIILMIVGFIIAFVTVMIMLDPFDG